MKKDIQSRHDIQLIVTAFYEKVQEDSVLGPIFTKFSMDWGTHIELLTTFWESSLFPVRNSNSKYYGNPLATHIEVDKATYASITERHFGIWLNLWFQTLDAYFEGDITEKAKQRARKMSTFMYLKIFEARQKSR